MSVREEFLNEKMQALLNRRTMPRGFEGKAQIQREEVQALVACLCRKAPRHAYDDWWLRVEEAIDEDAKTRAWPTVGEVTKAIGRVAGSVKIRVAEPEEKDPLEIIGKRIAQGLPVGDHYIWGRLAVDIVKAGHATEADLRAYRSGHFFHCKDTYGNEPALAMEAELKKRHAFAEEVGEEVKVSANAKRRNEGKN